MNDFHSLYMRAQKEWEHLEHAADPVIYIGMGSCGIASGAGRVWDRASQIIENKGLRQLSDGDQIAGMVKTILDENPGQVAEYLGGKDGLINWLFGQVMRGAKGKANPRVVREELDKQLAALRADDTP